MVSKLEYLGEHSEMRFFKEQTEHTGVQKCQKNFFYFFQVHNSIKNISLYGNILTIFDRKVKSLEVINYIKKISLLDSVLELQVNILIYYGDSLYFSKQII